ncbi:ATP-binding cassette domain-containing protein [Actinomadura sp. KC345]|uniref:ABC transporter ATP-binding protein n=1 Tax=Actinomadura sp. KC345 TaxID=2530371 RepID=UPI001042BEC8|nr:ATP-binding cassette domain-containing protein [Actinomadura sp. KC345]TDC45239.1 ATP-binding cassette domain-containing protein [Actinomadura sp. KC345]
MGIEVVVEGLTKAFGPQTIWRDVTLTLPKGEVSVLLGPSGTGKTVFLKSLIGLLKPEQGRVLIDGVDMVNDPDRRVYQARKRFGLMFQDGALFGSLSLFDNIAFPLREHTRKKESEIRSIVLERMEMVGLAGEERKLPGQLSGGMRKRAGLARALVLDPEVILCDEPDSGLDPVRTAYLSQVLIDVNARIDATMLIVTHNIEIAATVPDNIGMLYRRDLIAFGPREAVLTSDDPAVDQFLHGDPVGPIGMSEEKDAAALAAEAAAAAQSAPRRRRIEIPPQLRPTSGLPPRQGEIRHAQRIEAMLPSLPYPAQQAISAARRDRQEAGGHGGS